MKLPIQAQPIMRKISRSVAVGGVTPQQQKCPTGQQVECGSWIGTAPWCNAHSSACGPNQCYQTSKCGDGSCCRRGQKVRCCTPIS